MVLNFVRLNCRACWIWICISHDLWLQISGDTVINWKIPKKNSILPKVETECGKWARKWQFFCGNLFIRFLLNLTQKYCCRRFSLSKNQTKLSQIESRNDPFFRRFSLDCLMLHVKAQDQEYLKKLYIYFSWKGNHHSTVLYWMQYCWLKILNYKAWRLNQNCKFQRLLFNILLPQQNMVKSKKLVIEIWFVCIQILEKSFKDL